MAQLDAPSDWRPGGRGFNPCQGRQHSFVEIDHEIFSTVLLSLLLIQEGQLSYFSVEISCLFGVRPHCIDQLPYMSACIQFEGKGSCQFLAKECAQYWLTLRGLSLPSKRVVR